MTNKICIPESITPELAYLCGVIAGDGCITVRPAKKEWTVYCAGNANDEQEYYNEVIGPLMHKLFGLDVKLKTKSDGTYGFAVGSKELAAFLILKMNLPLGKKHEQLQIPLYALKSEEHMCAFIRGLFDTDGCMSFKRRGTSTPYYPVIEFCSKSTSFVEQIATLLFLLGFTPRLHERFTIDTRFAGGGNTICQLALNGYDNFELWNKKIGFWNPKHKEKILKYAL